MRTNRLFAARRNLICRLCPKAVTSPDSTLLIPLTDYQMTFDWVYLNDLQNAEDAKIKFDEWLINITKTNKNDGVKFRSFRENAFWRMIDYAMSDDFPTVN